MCKTLLSYLAVISVRSGTAFQFCFQLVYLWCECETYCPIVSDVLRYISGGVLFCVINTVRCRNFHFVNRKFVQDKGVKISVGSCDLHFTLYEIYLMYSNTRYATRL